MSRSLWVFNYFPVSELARKDTFQILGHKGMTVPRYFFCHRQPASWRASLPQNFKNTVCQSGTGIWSRNADHVIHTGMMFSFGDINSWNAVQNCKKPTSPFCVMSSVFMLIVFNPTPKKKKGKIS